MRNPDEPEDETKSLEKDELDKRKPKPYRYITDISESSSEQDLKIDTVMAAKSDITIEKLMEQFDSVVALGDMDAIERVVQKHEKRNQKHDPSIE